jgi:hypothetical protein
LRTAAPAGDLTVLYASELVVLLPQIGLQDFERGKEAENVDVSLGRCVGECPRREPRGEKSSTDGRRRERGAQDRTTRGGMFRLSDVYHHAPPIDDNYVEFHPRFVAIGPLRLLIAADCRREQ